jgi:TonB family protein
MRRQGRRALRARAWLFGLIALMFAASGPASTLGDSGRQAPTEAAADPEIAQLLDEAQNLFENHRFGAALKRYRAADEVAKGRSWDAIAGMVASFIKLERYEAAEDAAHRLVQLDQSREHLGLAHHLLGVALAGGDHLDDAEVALLKALGMRSGRPHHTLKALAAVLCRQGRWEEGLELLDDVGLCAQQELERDAREVTEGPVRWSENEGISPPEKLSGPFPVYPATARLGRIEGEVVVDTVIGPDGLVKCVRVLKGTLPEFSCSAAAAVFDWTFKPSMRDGLPIEVSYILTVRFNLD